MTISTILENNKTQIIDQYLSGISTNKLGKLFNCNSGTIYYKLKLWGISIKKKKKFDGDILDYEPKIISLFNIGYSAIKIGKELNISKPTVLRALKRNNCKLECTVDYNNLLKDKTHEVVLKYCLGQSTCSIAEELGFSQSAVWTLLDKNGVDMTGWKYKVDETFFDKIDTEEKAYVLGLWYSDGCVDEEGKMRIGLQEKDKHILEDIKKIMKYEGPLLFSPKESPNSNIWHLVINRKEMAEKLIKCGCIPNKSLTLKFPNQDILPIELQRHFIRGMSDGDGSVSENYWSLTSTDIFNNKIINITKEKFGFDCKYYYRYNEKNTCSLFINKIEDRIKFLDWIYQDSTIKLERKYLSYLKLKETNG